MSNALTLFGGNKVAVRDKELAVSAMLGSASKDPRGTNAEGALYLNFSGKLGKYSFGPENSDVDEDDVWLVNVHSFQDGWVCWKGGRPVARRFANMYEPPVPTPDLTEFGPFDSNKGEGWAQAKAFMLKHLTSGLLALFSNNTISGVSQVAGLQKKIGTQMHMDDPCWPLVTLGKEQFTAQGNKNFKPTFTVLGWLNDAQLQAVAEEGDGALDASYVDELVNQSAEPEGEAAAPPKPVAKKKTRRTL